MLEPVEVLAGPRRSLRREIECDCHLMSDLWDGAVRHPMRELSDEGMWIESDLPLQEGEAVVVRFDLPRERRTIYASGRVARARLRRRRQDRERSGMAIELTNLRAEERASIARSIAGMPPPVPMHSEPLEWVWIEGHELGL